MTINHVNVCHLDMNISSQCGLSEDVSDTPTFRKCGAL